MGTGILNNEEVAISNGRQRSLNGKLIVVFTKLANHINHLKGVSFFTRNFNVMIGTIHAGTH